jgi:two-component system NtrC family sensor kinase
MSAVGQLIAGVAHELNNPLTAILGYAQLLESEGLEDRAQDYVRKLFKQAQRTHRVVQNLLSFARQRRAQKQQIDLRKVLEETLTLREYDLKTSNIRVEREWAADTPPANADMHQMEQVFLNIINNALDAMMEKGGGGKLLVKTYGNGKFVGIEFLDSGPGIQDPKRIFDPFYTTKSVGKGTGLGLSICYGIVKEHGGDIIARNRPEGGAVIEIRIPVAGTVATPETSGEEEPKREMVIEGRLLLAEDEESMLEFERDLLVGAGAEVMIVKKRDEIKDRLLIEVFDAIVMNGKSNGVTAPEIYQWLAEKRPGMEKHILFTFATMDSETREFLEKNKIAFLVKPFEVGELIAATRKIMQKTLAAATGE